MQKPKPPRQWIVRCIFALLGVGLATLGFGLAHEGIFWISGYSARLGGFAFIPSLWYVGLGAILLMIGIIPWPRDPGPLKKRSKWRTHV